MTSASRSAGVTYQRASSPVESPTCRTSLQRAMSPRKQRRTASEGAVTSSTKTTARSSCGRSVGRNAAPSQSANAGSTCGAVTVDPALADWLGAALRPTLRPQDERAVVFVLLVTAPSEAVRRCFLGDIARCKDVLQVGDSTGLLARWYVTPAEREALVTEAFTDYFARGATAPSLQRCRQHRDDACTALLQSLPPGTLPRPLAQAARLLIVREALRAGGRDAYRRLVTRPSAPIGERLASAAGMDIDSLVARWRNNVLAARPKPLTLPWWASFAAIGWTAFFGFCALRSSRWRL